MIKEKTTVSCSVLQAKAQAWCIALLTVVADAHEYGAVLGGNAKIQTRTTLLQPSVVFVPKTFAKFVGADVIERGASLAIDVIHSGLNQTDRNALKQHYAEAKVNEYWQVVADKGFAALYQLSSTGSYDEIPPDKAGLHFAAAMEELVFPVKWFKEQPTIWKMMEWWGMISGDDEDE